MAELHPNDIGLAAFNDVGDVSALQTTAKVVVAAINELNAVAIKNYIVNGTGVKHVNASATALGTSASALGQSCTANGSYAFSAGISCTASTTAAIALGGYCTASGTYTFACGYYCQATSSYAHAEGYYCYAQNSAAHAEGYQCYATGAYSHAEGQNCYAQNQAAHAQGYYCYATGYYAHAGGMYTKARYCQTVIGRYNVNSAASDTAYNAAYEAFLIGNGTSDSARANCFKVTYAGNCSTNGSFSSPAGDYAEYFEWKDKNKNKEDRAGRFVKLEKGKIVFAEDLTDVLGVISAVPAIIGDSAEFNWKGKFLTDDFGRVQYHDVIVPAEYSEDGELMREETQERQPILNPDFDPSAPYVPRKDRTEWDAVGVIGKLTVYDDGTCESGDLCRPTVGGGATKSTTKKGYCVIKRMAADKILIWVR